MGRVRKARGKPLNRRLAIAELESLPDKEESQGYCTRREEEEEEGERKNGEEDTTFRNEFASKGGDTWCWGRVLVDVEVGCGGLRGGLGCCVKWCSFGDGS